MMMRLRRRIMERKVEGMMRTFEEKGKVGSEGGGKKKVLGLCLGALQRKSGCNDYGREYDC